MKKFVYSGKYRQCECGLETGVYDTHGRRLKTGDIVLIYTEDNDGLVAMMPDHLTVVIESAYTSVTYGKDDTRYTPIDHPDKPFIMGIKNVDIEDSDWNCIRVKAAEDVIHGEHWRSFGFSFKEEES